MNRAVVMAAALVGLAVGACMEPVRPTDFVPPEDSAAADPDAVVRGNTRFALELYAKLCRREGNVFFSPLSVSTALAMTSAGARGRTLEEMTRVLHLPEQARLHPAMAGLEAGLLARSGRHVELSLANALWGQMGKAFLPEFQHLLRRHYRAGLHQVDFAGSPGGAREAINRWTEQRTRGKIKDLLPREAVTADTRLVLTNAVYFKADWASPFKKSGTEPGDFRLAGGATVRTPLMWQEGTFGYLEGEGFQALEMPYVNKDLAMVIFLPEKPGGLGELERRLTPENLASWTAGLREQEVRVTLPRFKMTEAAELKKTLTEMGMGRAFSRSADFGGMDGGAGRLGLSAVIHKAFLDVAEEGAEAAAATAVVVAPMAAAPPPMAAPVPVFCADRPFLLLIRDRKTGSILFLGRLTNPTG
jgi:serpin B